jgi:hypothetical protein
VPDPLPKVRIEARLVNFSDYVATNGHATEILKRNRRLELAAPELKSFESRFLSQRIPNGLNPSFANPIQIIVNIITRNDKLLLWRDTPLKPFVSPVFGFIQPLRDAVEILAVPSLKAAALRHAYRNLGITFPQVSIHWLGLIKHRFSGICSIIGEWRLLWDDSEFQYHHERGSKEVGGRGALRFLPFNKKFFLKQLTPTTKASEPQRASWCMSLRLRERGVHLVPAM